jgi:DNA primase
VEGYLDVLAMHQHGFTNTVATLGTSLTVEHVRMLRRGFAKKAYLVFDSDAAGMRAAHRSAPIFMDESVDAAILVLPEGHDPDSFLREFGARAFREISDNARGTMTFLIEAAIKKHGLSMEGRIRVIDDLLQPLGTLSDHLMRSVYVRDLAERLNIDESAIVEKIRRTARQSDAGAVSAASKENGSFSGDRIEKSSGISELFRIERQIIAMMIHAPELVEHIETEGVLNYFYDRRLRKIGDLILSRPASARHDLNGLMHDLDDPELRELAASLAMESGNWGTRSCRTLINQYVGANQRRGDTLLNRIREAGDCNDLDLQFSLLKEKQRQIRRRQ